jgi:hypothetical protein
MRGDEATADPLIKVEQLRSWHIAQAKPLVQ